MPAKPKLPLVVFSDDEPNGDSSQDSLRLRSIAEGAAGAAISSRGPITIGTFGKWGGGRTSVLRQGAKALLEAANSKALTVWYGAWQFDREVTQVVPLALQISEAARDPGGGDQDGGSGRGRNQGSPAGGHRYQADCRGGTR